MRSRKVLLVITTALLLCNTIINASAVLDEYNVDEISHDYYNVYGQPHITAVISGDNTFKRGDEGTLFITLLNDGGIHGYEADDGELDDDIADYSPDLVMGLAAAELNLDRQVTTAKSMTGKLSLVNADTPLEIKIDTVLIDSLQVGKSTTDPLNFPIRVYNNARAGIYELRLDITYTYQKDSAVSPPYSDTYFWDVEGNDTAIITIEIEEQPFFEVIETTSYLTAGESGMLEVTYKNVGDVTAYDTITRISTVDPFSTTDDQAYLGDMATGESRTALYKINVDDTATAKSYAIKNEIKYDDKHGDIQYSKALKAVVNVKPAVPFSVKVKESPTLLILLILGIIGTPIYLYIKRKK
ncbi:MAG: hypothetical protein C5S41_03790 [Candidatus Methanomarinus sp.]|nr:MAG: hypothetical protein C5S41_03790 [ANME-2 cluster archaeon]